MKEPLLSRTDDYHKQVLSTLIWEVTLSVMLEDHRSLCRSILQKNESFGNLLYDFLCTIIPMESIRSIIEVGGGYGYLMRDFLIRNKGLCATMIEISPALIEKQKALLGDFNVRFIHDDFFLADPLAFSNIDLAILNEVIGDFPTACNVPANSLFNQADPDDSGNAVQREVFRVRKKYGIVPAVGDQFTVNLGAIQALERLCIARIPNIYISEHSCEARVPERLAGLLALDAIGEPKGVPERIRLYGHDEYTVRFSDLEQVAKSFGYKVRRGQYIDFIEPIIDDEVEFILRLGSSKIDRHEIIRQFIEDLVKYEYLVLSLPA